MLFVCSSNSEANSHCKIPTSQKQVNITNPCRMEKTKSRGEHLPLRRSVCAHQLLWEVIDPWRPFAHKLRRRSRNNKDFCSCLSTWPLIFLSRRARNADGTSITDKDQMLPHDESGTSQRQLQMRGTSEPPVGSLMLSKDARINSTYSPQSCVWTVY